jgi:nitrite reductase (NO-forming)
MSRVNRPILLACALTAAVAGAAAAGVVAHAGSTRATIHVTAREYHLTISTKTATGAVLLVVKNSGKLAHRIEIAGKGVKKTTPLIAPGKSATLRVTLTSGKYSIWCTVPGHAQLGMKTSVSAAAAATGGGASGGGSTTTSTDTSGSGGGDSAWG